MGGEVFKRRRTRSVTSVAVFIAAWNNLVAPLKHVIANVLKFEKAHWKTIFKWVCIIMHSLVMSPFSRYFAKTQVY